MKFFQALVLSAWFYQTVMAGFQQIEKMIARDSFSQIRRSSPDEQHEVVIAVQQKNLDVLERMVLERSTPGSPLYQSWMTYDEVGALIRNDEGHSAAVRWLEENGVSVSWSSKRKEYIRASTSIATWERMLNTKFYEWEDSAVDGAAEGSLSRTKTVLHRSEDYSLPAELTAHVTAVFNTCEVLSLMRCHLRQLYATFSLSRFISALLSLLSRCPRCCRNIPSAC